MDNRWKNCLIDFLRSLRSDATRTSYANVLLRFFSLHPDPSSVTKRDIEAFMRAHFPDPHRTKQGELAVATQNARVGAIGSFFKWASSYIPEGETEPLWQRANPTTGIVRGKAERAVRGLALEELERLFSVMSPVSEIGIRDRAALIFYLFSARRRSEIAELHYSDIEPATFPDGKGGTRDGWIYHFYNKGSKSVRDSAELVPIVKQALDWYLISSGRMETIQPSDPLFTTVGSKTKPMTASTIAKRMAHYSKKANLSASLHTLRHTSSRARFESGENARSIQHLLRHRNLSTTDLYLRTLVGTEDPGYKLLLEKFEHL